MSREDWDYLYVERQGIMAESEVAPTDGMIREQAWMDTVMHHGPRPAV